jgi:hypothetical protein
MADLVVTEPEFAPGEMITAVVGTTHGACVDMLGTVDAVAVRTLDRVVEAE